MSSVLGQLVEKHRDSFSTVRIYGEKLTDLTVDQLRAFICAQNEKYLRQADEHTRQLDVLAGRY